MMKRFGFALLLTGALTLGACEDEVSSPSAPDGGRMMSTKAAPEGLADQAMTREAKSPAQQPKALQGRQIIRRAEVSIEVENVAAQYAKVNELAKSLDGFASDARWDTAEGDRPTAYLTFRLPAKSFDNFLNALGDIGTVQSRGISSEDVTAEYVDTEARLRNLRREEQQYLRIMEKANTVKDVLQVEKEIARVRGEIEATDARMRKLSELIDLSTIVVTLRQRLQIAEASPWNFSPALFEAYQDAQHRLAKTLGAFLAGGVWLFLYFIPFFIPLLILYLGVGRLAAWLVVTKMGWLSKAQFSYGWTALGLSGLAIAYPKFLGFVALIGFSLLLLWGGTWAYGRFFKRAVPTE